MSLIGHIIFEGDICGPQLGRIGDQGKNSVSMRGGSGTTTEEKGGASRGSRKTPFTSCCRAVWGQAVRRASAEGVAGAVQSRGASVLADPQPEWSVVTL